MKFLSVLTTAAILSACAFNTKTVNAQGTPSFGADRLSGNQTNRTFYIEGGDWTIPSPYIQFVNHTSTDATSAGSIGYIAGYNASNPAGISHTFYSRTSTLGWVSHMRILQNGQVQIGQQTPGAPHTNYKLAVDGKLVAKSIYVTAPGTWADFVFDSTYKYMQLPELETYLQHNKHLPAMPSAGEVEANGYSMSEMDAKLLQTVEELTLRIIELNKQNVSMQAEMVLLKEQLNQQAIQKNE